MRIGTLALRDAASVALALALTACATTSPAVQGEQAPAMAPTMVFDLPSAGGSDLPKEAKIVVDAPAAKIATIVLRRGTVMPEHASPVAVTIVALSGAGTVVIGDQRLRFDATHGVLLAPAVSHSVEPDAGTDLVLLVHHLGRTHGEH